ncbi:Cyanate hydratase [Physocladia obscura]|uniref:Cyanate hydratase n=1 Tax=Physocladia obscura TaxID=109957 RepID=A0AAD5SRX5_9FUNG|nr:Cyanate hydratase [Physocladia obscura]
MSSRFSTLGAAGKAALVRRLLAAKEISGLSFDAIAARTSTTNLYAAQIFHGQAQATPRMAAALHETVPGISSDDLEQLQRSPVRTSDAHLASDPTVYRFQEAVNLYAASLKAVINEKCGDGIMSAIDMYSRVDVVKGVHGEDRVVVTLSGKFLPHIEQLEHLDTSKGVTPATTTLPSKSK